VSLAKLSLPVKMRLRVVPSWTLKRWSPRRPSVPKACGSRRLQLYRDGNYAGATSWNRRPPAWVLPFGRDSLVRVKVDRAKDRNGRGGIIERRNEREVSDLFTLTSFHKTPVELLVLEASPVSTNDQIKVEAKSIRSPRTKTGKSGRVWSPGSRYRAESDAEIQRGLYDRLSEDAAVAGLP